ncbi:unnamed protein product [Macrosiphum euphorbiae]|uniref:Uncharacterized protein n=1 Tax=Macrosiphum euphorbiae TaxID=13131 RepID=A0AAV0XW37_9HEMI|nr:unnamed protein product [Macrosiphum euphorbiae]
MSVFAGSHFKFTGSFFNYKMNKYSKLNNREVENILVEIPGDDGGLTDLEDESDDDYLVEEKNYLDLLDSSANVIY